MIIDKIREEVPNMSVCLNIGYIARSKYLFVLLSVLCITSICSVAMAGNMLNEEEITKIRPEIRRWISELTYFQIVSVAHTTDSIKEVVRKKRIPDSPKPFDAGRFKITFMRKAESRSIICQTEANIGHYALVIPGQTDVGGYVQILDNPEDIAGSGPKLDVAEEDLLVRAIYAKFSEPLSNDEVDLHNKTKDYILAIMFSGKSGIKEYHNELIRELRKRRD